MSVNGVGGAVAGLRMPQAEPRTRAVDPERAPAAAPASVATPKPLGRTQPLSTPQTAALTPEAPEGTDPELWSVLTAEERAFFARVGAMGPLTYGHIMTSGGSYAANTPVKRGGRLDVRI